VVAGATHLATPLLAVLFSYFALRKLYFRKRKCSPSFYFW